jgi:hypothetical protein
MTTIPRQGVAWRCGGGSIRWPRGSSSELNYILPADQPNVDHLQCIRPQPGESSRPSSLVRGNPTDELAADDSLDSQAQR